MLASYHCGAATTAAREHRWPNDLGIALQISARCHAALGDEEKARHDLGEARDAFSAWGASAKAEQLAAAIRN